MSNWFERMERESEVHKQAEAAIQTARTAEMSELVEALRIHELVENVRDLWGVGDIALDIFDKSYTLRDLRSEVYTVHRTYRKIRGSSPGMIMERHGESGHPIGPRWSTGEPDHSEIHSYTSVFLYCPQNG